MDAEAATRIAGRRALPLVVAALAPVLLVLAAIAAVFLGATWLFAAIDEGATPPLSRLPAVPDGVAVVSQKKECGSGGCWWEIALDPADDQSPADLATSMGLADDMQLPGTLLDPRETWLSADVVDGELLVQLGYVPLVD